LSEPVTLNKLAVPRFLFENPAAGRAADRLAYEYHHLPTVWHE